ncbi:MAG TPA: DUF4349 domain-containing protein, partial [Chloroflexota bacterium]|nr:DUF4349 domain-containing protein [Chloroflexota bacterium]
MFAPTTATVTRQWTARWRAIRSSRARLAVIGAALGATAVVLGGVACSAITSPANNASGGSSPAATSVPGKAAQPGIPAASPARNLAVGAPVAAGAAAVTSDAAAQAAPAASAPGNASTANTASSTTLEQSAAQPLDRMVIRTAQMTVEVGDMESALGKVRAIASRGGGFVSASNTRVEKVNDQDRTVADLTIQVRSDAVDSALSDLRGLGKVT